MKKECTEKQNESRHNIKHATHTTTPKTVYLDNGATTALDLKVFDHMKEYLVERYGNASSMHHKGEEAKQGLIWAREVIAKSIGAEPKEIIFTSGGTESNNLALKGIALNYKNKGNHIIISKIEHDCVLNAAKWLEKNGFTITYLDVDSEGFIQPEILAAAITPQTILVSIIHANNEIGTIQNMKALYEVCKKHNVILHTDACQSYTKTVVTIEFADLITLNAHKIHGPKGVGALFIKKGIRITPLAHGGGHERNLRSGTENIPGIVGFAKSVEVAFESNYTHDAITKMTTLRDYFIEKALKIPDTRLNGPQGNARLCNNVNISFRYIEGESIMAMLDIAGICASTGSACSSHNLDPSHVLMALEADPERAHGSIRFSFSKWTTKEELDYTLEILSKSIETLRKISPMNKEYEVYVHGKK